MPCTSYSGLSYLCKETYFYNVRVAAKGFSTPDGANIMHALFGFFLIITRCFCECVFLMGSIAGVLLRRDILKSRTYDFGVAMMAFGTGILLMVLVTRIPDCSAA